MANINVVNLGGAKVGEFELSDFGSSEIYYVDVCHRSSLFAPAIDAASKNFV